MLKKLSPIFSNITGVVRYQDLAYVARYPTRSRSRT